MRQVGVGLLISLSFLMFLIFRQTYIQMPIHINFIYVELTTAEKLRYIKNIVYDLKLNQCLLPIYRNLTYAFYHVYKCLVLPDKHNNSLPLT